MESQSIDTQTEGYVAPQLDYKKYNYSYPVYKHSKIFPIVGTQAVTVTTAGGQESIFEIPAKVFNLSKSYLSFTMTGVISAGVTNWVASDLIPHFRQIQLYTRGGLFLADINNCDNFTKATLKTEIKIDDLLTFDKMSNARQTFGNSIRPSDTTAGVGPFGFRYNGTPASSNFNEVAYCYPGTVGAANPVLNYKINLGLLKNSLFSLDRDLFMDEVIVLRLVWNQTNKFMWTAGSATDPSAAVLAAYANNVNISNLQLFLAVETNQEIVTGIRNLKNSEQGLSLLMPFVYGNKINLTGSTQTISLRYNRAHGLKLLKVFHQPVNNAETINTAYDASNILGARCTSFYTMLNNNRLQEFDVLCNQCEDYMILKDRLEGSLMLDANVYQYNWVWLDDFSGSPSMIDEKVRPDLDNYIRGIDLSTEQKYDILLNIAGGTQLNHYTFAIVQRMLVVNQNGIQIM
jgi:hypothetical protein